MLSIIKIIGRIKWENSRWIMNYLNERISRNYCRRRCWDGDGDVKMLWGGLAHPHHFCKPNAPITEEVKTRGCFANSVDSLAWILEKNRRRVGTFFLFFLFFLLLFFFTNFDFYPYLFVANSVGSFFGLKMG